LSPTCTPETTCPLTEKAPTDERCCRVHAAGGVAFP
jgi:hypothetical protein